MKDFNGLAERVDASLQQSWSAAESSRLEAAARYAVFGPGKRFRGSLVFAVGEMVGAADELLGPVAAASELLHASSLVHDDLPAVDDDDYRRGQPSCHRKFGEDVALLAGNWLAARAFETLAGVKSPASAEITALFAAAFASLCAGQVLDLESLPPDLSENEKIERLLLRHSLKTAALIQACAVSPLLLVSANQRQGQFEADKSALSEFGEQLGILFQLTDDLLDWSGAEEGRGTDRDSGADTFVSVLGEERVRSLAAHTAEKAKCALLKLPYDSAQLQLLCGQTLSRLA